MIWKRKTNMINIFEVMKNTSQTSRCNLIIQILRNNRQSGSIDAAKTKLFSKWHLVLRLKMF